jgi:hypothetical protein
MNETQHNSRAAAIAALAVLLLGPVPLALMWCLMSWPSQTSGFWDFRSGSVGDLLVLPTLTALLATTAFRQRDLPHYARFGVAAAAALGAAGSALVQYSWWADANPPRQWGLTAPHQFSIAGWWHGTFFVLVSSMLCGLWAATLFGARASLPALERLQGRVAAIAFCVASFATLVTLDASSSVGSVSSMSSLLGLAAATLVLIVPAATLLRGDVVSLVAPTGAGAVAGTLTALCLLPWPPVWWSMMGAIVALGASLLGLRRVGQDS